MVATCHNMYRLLCESLCPQHIPIMKSLDEVKKNMEGVGFRIMGFVVKLFLKKKVKR